MKTMSRILALGLALLATISLAPLAQAGDEAAAQAQYIAAVSPKGESKDIAAAEASFKGLLAEAPGHAGYRARLASLEAMKANHVWMPWTKGKHSDEAIRQFDEVWKDVRATEDASRFEFHFYRGQTYVHFPKFLGKRDLALSDLKAACDLGTKLGRPGPELAVAYRTLAKALKDDGKEAESRAADETAARLEQSK